MQQEVEGLPGFTKQAIRNSFIKLLNQRPVNQITIKDIVEDCGINRNSFYYHYQDLPSMIEEIILDEVNVIIRQNPTIDSLEECLNVTMSFVRENRRAAIHLYHSSNRDLFEQYLWKVSEYTVRMYISTVLEPYSLKESDIDVIIRMNKWECFGAVMDWLREGTKEDIEAVCGRIAELKRGTLEEIIRRSQET